MWSVLKCLILWLRCDMVEVQAVQLAMRYESLCMVVCGSGGAMRLCDGSSRMVVDWCWLQAMPFVSRTTLFTPPGFREKWTAYYSPCRCNLCVLQNFVHVLGALMGGTLCFVWGAQQRCRPKARPYTAFHTAYRSPRASHTGL